MNFTSSLLGHPDRLLGAEESRDGEEPEVGVESTLSDVVPSTMGSSVSATTTMTPPEFLKGIPATSSKKRKSTKKKAPSRASSASALSQAAWSSSSSSSDQDGDDILEARLRKKAEAEDDDATYVDVSKTNFRGQLSAALTSRKNRNQVDVSRRGNDVGGDPFAARPMTTIGSRNALEGRRGVPSLKQLREETEEEEEDEEEEEEESRAHDGLSEEDDGEEADDDSSVAVMDSKQLFDDVKERRMKKMEEAPEKTENAGFVAVKGQPGMFYKRHLLNPVDVYQRKM